ncbi:hypothetical protein K7472_31530 [Streptomyces sp. PTM05]|uniref:Uncharacterized protein n=1 Tax=Streptantibioticus parmotrematis TaxID=2873249 RepID=A0ABS7R1L8_9ACTN|nr:hypothetical protein [Streptantibioticus parmotrematis]MBY8889340.1 hypothetical protein [Streptantibioticus parmotrematis]
MFALVKDPHDQLEVVTTLGADDLHLTTELVNALNGFLSDRDETVLETLLDVFPIPVSMAVQQYVKNKCAPVLGAFNGYGPIDVVREAVYFSRGSDDLEEYLDSAYMIGLGVRVSNQRSEDGDVGWDLQLLSDEVSVPASAEPRTWELPSDVKLLKTWTSAQLLDSCGPVGSALSVAEGASDQGRWVRIHTLLHSDRDIEFEGSGTSEFVVDIFDAPIPLEYSDE